MTPAEQIIVLKHSRDRAQKVLEQARANESAAIMRRQKADRVVEDLENQLASAEDAAEKAGVEYGENLKNA